MSHVNETREDDSSVQQYFNHLDRWDKVASWVYGGLIVGCALLLIVAGVVLLS